MASLLDYAAPATDRVTSFAVPDENMPVSERLKGMVARAGGSLDAAAKGFGAFNVALYQQTFADFIQQPGEVAKLFGAAERQTRLVDNTFAADQAREEAYDRRIKAVKDATGVELENPERSGYALDEKQLRALSSDGPVDPAAIRRGLFERALGALRNDHPDKQEQLTFGNIDEEAKWISAGAEDQYEAARRDTKLALAPSLVTELAGGMWGQRRNPIQVGALFAGPTGAVGRSVAARIVSSGLMQGFYNAGLEALEQPSVQAWRAEIGAKSGVTPALERVGMAFLFGAIPGAFLRGLHEIPAGSRAPVQRVLDGMPEAGDVEKAAKALPADLPPTEQRAIQLGTEIDDAAKATAPARAKDVPPELHVDLANAALRHAEDPIGQPSPAAVAAIKHIEAFHGSPHEFEVFDLRNAGSGSGDQSEGFGIYLSSARKSAEDYRNASFDLNYEPEGEGFLYRVKFQADRSHLIQWEKSFVEQSGHVKKALTPFFDSGILDRNESLTGEQIYDRLVQSFGDAKTASKALAVHGIPGVEYIEHGSMNEHIPNFVAFDESLLQITHKNDRPLSPSMQEVQARVAAAQPRNEREAAMAASEALEDIGNRESTARTRVALDEPTLPPREPPPEGVKPPPASSKDPLDRIPLARENGEPTTVSARQVARQGERETQLADLIRECK